MIMEILSAKRWTLYFEGQHLFRLFFLMYSNGGHRFAKKQPNQFPPVY